MSPTETALRVHRSPARFGAARLAGVLGTSSAAAGPLRLDHVEPLELPTPDWVRLRPRLSGICGSDLATVQGRSSQWFEPIVSFPFVPGHEVVADDPEGRRVVVEPVLGCVARGISPPCGPCAAGQHGNCERISLGCSDHPGAGISDVAAGLQSGYCCDTGGGWSTEMVAHPSQLHPVPDELDDRAAAMIEPTACAVHAALAAKVQPDETVAVIGAGTLGVLCIAALQRWSRPAAMVVAAKYPHQRQLIRSLTDASAVLCAPDELPRAVRRQTGTLVVGSFDRVEASGRLSGGADVTIDCVGNAESITTAMAITRPKGRIVLVGMPATEQLDLTPLWQRELSLSGAYAYGTEQLDGSSFRTFDLAAELVAASELGHLVSATYPLERHHDAIAHASAAGPRGATKIAFDLRDPDHPAAPKKAPRR